MLRTVVGVPRSGKTYYLVQFLLSFCLYDPISRTWDLKPRILIITNIDGLKINTQNFDLMLLKAAESNQVVVKRFPSETDLEYEKRKGIVNFFYVPTWEKLSKRYDKIIVAIDEIQSYLPSFDRTIPNSVFYWFEYHGHFGAEVFAMSQSAESIHRRVLAVNETFVEAQSPSMRVKKNLFKYTLRDSQSYEVVGSEFINADPKVFKAYKSARHKEGIKERGTFITKYWVMAAAIASIIPIAGYFFLSTFQDIADRSMPIKEVNASEPTKNILSDYTKYIKKAVVPVVVPDIPKVKEFSRSNIMRWSRYGLDYNEIEAFPKSCEIFTTFVRCPPYSIPSEYKKMMVNYLCPGKSKQCYFYFPLKSDRSDETVDS